MTSQIPLTRQQARALHYIEAYTEASDCAPPYEQIMHHMGLKSKSGVHRIIMALEERHRIRRIPHRARAIAVIKTTCPHCGGEIN